MATHCYDCLFVFNSNKFNRDPGGVAASLDKLVEGLGGEMLASRLWEERKLAYPIEGQNKGVYWITYFKIEGSKLTEFNRTCQLDDNILRHLVTKIDPRLIDALVAHTLGHSEAESEEEEQGEKTKNAAEASTSTVAS